jgi:hypothetical protein
LTAWMSNPYDQALFPPGWYVRCYDELRQVYSVFDQAGQFVTAQGFQPLEPFTLASHLEYLWTRWLQMGGSFR